MDECGERGEYHTMVCDGARFARRVELETEPARDGVYAFRRILSARLVPKP
jgi:diphthamide synthase (EF-2-diphthine--ammonia ligase)